MAVNYLGNTASVLLNSLVVAPPAPPPAAGPPAPPDGCIWIVDASGARVCVLDPNRDGYCSAEGNRTPAGEPIPLRTFLDLVRGQPSWDPSYRGATLAALVPGLGLTCREPYVPYPVGSPYGTR